MSDPLKSAAQSKKTPNSKSGSTKEAGAYSTTKKPVAPAQKPTPARVQEVQSKNAPPTFKEDTADGLKNDCKDCTCEKGCDDDCRKEIKEYSDGKAPATPPHTSDDIANATIAVFGEMSPAGNSPDTEAKAIASCLFNRMDDVTNAREDAEKLINDPERTQKIAALNDEITGIEEQGKRLRTPEAVKENHTTWARKVKERDGLEGQRNTAAAKANRLANQFLGSKDGRANLTNVATSGKNFGGHGRGMEYVNDVLTCRTTERSKVGGKLVTTQRPMSCADLKSYCRRWRAAKKAVADMAAGGSRDPYRYMYSNFNGKRERELTDTRVDGNDFSQGPMKEQR